MIETFGFVGADLFDLMERSTLSGSGETGKPEVIKVHINSRS